MIHNYLDPTDPLGSYYYGPQPGDDFNEEDAFRRALRALATLFLAIVVAVILCALLDSCTTPQASIVERVTHDTVQVTRLQRDSIFRHDSIYIREHNVGDTVYLEVTRWHTQYRDRWHHDSIYLSRRDTVPVPYPVEKRVPAQLSSWQQMQLWLGRLVLVALAVLAAWWIVRKRTWWLRLIK
jgi:hypothetical protein